jgi:protein O-mannosyl-transferase
MKRQRNKQNRGEARSPSTSSAAPAILSRPSSLLVPFRQDWLLALVLVIGTILAYHPVWRAGFIWDDDLHVTANRLLWERGGLKKIWASPDAPQYYPMVFTSFLMEYALWGANAPGYHWVNLLLHATSALLAWRVFQRLGVPGAWVAAAVFALHPVNVESVAWISERKNCFCMVFYLLSLLLYLRSEPLMPQDISLRSTCYAPRLFPSCVFRPPRPVLYWLSVLAFVLALLSKTAVAPMPLVLLGLTWWRRGRLTATDLGRSAPFFAAAIILSLVTVWIEQLKTSAPSVMREDTFWAQLAGAGWAVWFYLYKAVLPIGLNYVYPQWHINPSNPLAYVPDLLLIGVAILLWVFRGSWGRPCLFCLGYSVLMLLPILGFLNIGYFGYSHVADHWQYFAIIAPIALAVGYFAWKADRGQSHSQLSAGSSPPFERRGSSPSPAPRPIRMSAPPRLQLFHWVEAAVLAALFISTWRHSAWFADAKTIWSRTLAGNPAAWIAHHQLGLALEREGKVAEAVTHYEAALAGQPDFATAEINLGSALQSLGRNDEAREHFLAAVRLKPDIPEAYNNLGNLYARQGNAEAALTNSLAAVRLRPDWAEAHYNLANALFLQGKQEEAVGQYNQALRFKPNYFEAHQNLGLTLEKLGRNHEAAQQYAELIRQQPEFSAAYHRLALVFARQGLFSEAVKAAEEGLRLATSAGQSAFAEELRTALQAYQRGAVPEVPRQGQR